ncbi:MAG: NAD(P)/FAD-dependent oxidoreductase, partial [candidate division WOR-3 bacterium]
MIEKFDLVIVGAGPAGSCAAWAAAREGLSVVILERHKRVGEHILCAEGISRSTVDGWLDIKPHWISTKLRGAVVKSPSRRIFQANYPDVGYILERKIFDAELAGEAVKAGAKLICNAEAIEIQDKKLIYLQDQEKKEVGFGFIIGADGCESRIGRLAGLKTFLKLNEIHICAQYLLGNLNIESDYAQFYLDEDIAPGGYAWVFPKSKDRANVGLGISPLKAKQSVRIYLDHWVTNEFSSATKLRFICGGVPAKIMKQFTSGNCFLAGDAARFCDPLSGGGIANAVKSGFLAGINAARILKGKKSEYEKAIKKEVL